MLTQLPTMALRASLLVQRAVLRPRCAQAPVARFTRSSSSSSTTASQQEVPAHLNTKRGDYLLNFSKYSAARDAFHYTSYFLAAGVPASLLIGPPISTVVDHVLSVAVPLHFHVGMRSVLVDYVHDVPTQRIAFMALAGVTVLTAVGLIKLNTTDIGITETVKALWVKQSPPAERVTAGKH